MPLHLIGDVQVYHSRQNLIRFQGMFQQQSSDAGCVGHAAVKRDGHRHVSPYSAEACLQLCSESLFVEGLSHT